MLHVSVVWHVEPGLRYEPNLIIDEEYISCLFDLIDMTPNIRHTLLVQADDSILSATGRPDYLFYRFGSEFCKLSARGHEIGWHFHPIEKQGGLWQQSLDPSFIVSAADRAFSNIHFENPITVCSTGWCFGSNELTAIYRKLGLRVDCSALPGLFHQGVDVANRYGNLGRVNHFDWRQSPLHPYIPSYENYQIESQDGKGTLVQFPALTTRDRLVSLNESVHWYASAYRGVKQALLDGHDIFFQLYSHSYNMRRVEQRKHFYRHIELLSDIARQTQTVLNFCTVSSAIESWLGAEKGIDLRSYIQQEPQWITFGKRLLHRVGAI